MSEDVKYFVLIICYLPEIMVRYTKSAVVTVTCNVLPFSRINQSTNKYWNNPQYVLISFASQINCLLICLVCVNPLTAMLLNLNFQPLEVVSRYRDPQL